VLSSNKISEMKLRIFKILIVTILTFFQSNILNAQYLPLVEESKYWIYYDFQKRPRPTTGFLITIKGDTIVQNTVYKKVYKYELGGEVKTVLINEPPIFVADIPYNLIDKELVSLIREDVNEKQIYNLPIKLDSCTAPSNGVINPCNDIIFCDTLEHLLFDFSLSTGDTLNYCCYAPLHYTGQNIPEEIDSIKFEMHFGKLRNTFFTYGVASYLPNLIEPGPIPPSRVRIIEGVGFQNQGIFNYRYGSLVYYCEGDLEDCNIVSATKEVYLDESHVKVYPNPASDCVTVESNEEIGSISLIAPNGIELMTVSNENLLNLSNIPGGIYIIKIRFENGNIRNQRIVKMKR
jgi:type IX secretion system substrate protein